MIKKTIGLVFVAAILVGAAVLTTQHYNKEYKNKKQHETTMAQKAASEAQAKVQAAAQAAKAKMVEQYNLLVVECEKGKNAHSKLPAYIAKATPTPQCGSVLQ